MARRRPRRVRILLPGEKEGRRGFLKKGLLGAALLAAAGGGAWLATRRTRPGPAAGLRVFDAAQAAVLAAVAERLVPHRPSFPRPARLDIAGRIDAVAAMAHPATQKELRQLVWLLESALGGLLDGSPRLFTECDGPAQDRRLRAWATSRIAVRRTGFRALRRLVAGAYYSAEETWGAVGYPGPPITAPRRSAPQRPPRAAEEPAAEPRAPQASPDAAPMEEQVPPPRPKRFRPAPVEPIRVEPVPVATEPPGGDGGP